MAVASDPNGLQIYKRLLRYVVPHWRAFVLALLGMLFVAGTETGFAWLIKPFLDGSFVERDPEIIQMAPIVIIVLFLVRGLAAFLSQYWMSWIARQVIKVLRTEIFNQLLRLPVAFFDRTPSGSLLSKLIYDVEQVARASTDVITVLIRDTLTVLGLLGLMFYINWLLAAVLLTLAPLFAYFIQYISKRFRRYSTRLQGAMADVTQVAEEAIEGQRVVKIFGGQQYEAERFEKTNENNRRLNMKLEATNAASVPVVLLIAALGSSAVIYLSLGMLDTLTVGTFMSFLAAMMMLHAPMKRLTQVNASLQRGISGAESIFQFIDLPAELDQGRVLTGRARGAVEFRDVGFRYLPEKEEVLKGINLRIEAGQTVAFVGRSGSGKTTLASLLPRFYELSSGQILLDGQEIRDIRLDDLRDQVALVSQHITLFNDTVANNIAYGRLGTADRDAIVRAAEAAHAMEFIRQLPEGLDTHVGENGVLLSGGQRQRLAIARALLKDAPVLILDEATSALDTASERHIQAALEELMTNRTTLVIAHRLSTIERADLIVVMDQGRIVESGKHAELLANNGAYAALYRMQFNDAVPEALPA